MRKTHLFAAVFALGLSLGVDAAVLMDPQGDTLGFMPTQIDLKSVEARYTATDLSFDLMFYHPVDASNLAVFIDIDSDQDPLTGEVSTKSLLLDPSGLGIEYLVQFDSNLFPDPEVIDAATFATVSTLTAVFGLDSLSITVPLADLGGDGGAVNYAALVGTVDEITDVAPAGMVVAASMPSTAASVPEPSMAFGLLTLFGVGYLRRRRR